MEDKVDSKLSKSKRTQGIGLNKTGFIFKATMNINFLPSLTSTPSLAVLIKREKVMNYSGCFITNHELDIMYLSTETINIFNITEKGLWSIRNYNNLSKGDRINLKGLIKELKNIENEADLKSAIDSYRNIDDIKLVHYLEMNQGEEEDYSDQLVNKRNMYNNYSVYKKNDSDNNLNDCNSIKGILHISEAKFGKLVSDYYIVKVEIKMNVKNKIQNLRFKEDSTFNYDGEHSQIIIKNKYFKDYEMSPNNSRLDMNPKSVTNSPNKKGVKPKTTEEEIDEMDLYQSIESKKRGIKNYALDIKLFKWDYIKCMINKLHVDEHKQLKDLVYGVEEDSVQKDSDFDDDEELETANSKIEIKKFEIFSQKNSVKTDSVTTLRYTSLLIFVIHFAVAIIYFFLAYFYLNQSKEYIMAVEYLNKQLNYSVSSADLLMTRVIQNTPGFVVTQALLDEQAKMSTRLESNALAMYSLDSSINELRLFYTNNLSTIINNTVTFNYIENQAEIPVFNKLSFNFFESNLEVYYLIILKLI